MGFPREEYWTGLHLLLQGIFLTHLSLQGTEEAKGSPDALDGGFHSGLEQVVQQ